MTITSEPQVSEPVAPQPRRRRPSRWVALGAALVLVLAVAGAVTAMVWHRPHADARPLQVDSTEILWVGNVPMRTATAGPYSAAVTTAGLGDQRTFVLYVHNPSAVTQTVLGLGYSSRHTATPESIMLSSKNPDMGPGNGAPFTKPPVAIPPHDYRALYYTVRIERCLLTKAQLYWTSLDLRVRSGSSTRRETLQFGAETSAYVIQGNAQHC